MSTATANPPASTPDGLAAELWGRPEVAVVFKVSAETIKRWEKEGRLPAPLRVGARPLWPANVIRAIASGEAR